MISKKILQLLKVNLLPCGSENDGLFLQIKFFLNEIEQSRQLCVRFSEEKVQLHSVWKCVFTVQLYKDVVLQADLGESRHLFRDSG